MLFSGNVSEFRKAVRLVVDKVNFDKSNVVQVIIFALPCLHHLINIFMELFLSSYLCVLLAFVQVFEANIRLLGGLLSAHLLMEDEDKTFGDLTPDWYTHF